MPTKVVPPVDVTAYHWCRLLEAIRGAVPPHGVAAKHLPGFVQFQLEDGYSDSEYRAAVKSLRESGAIEYKRGVYSRGRMF